MKVRRRMTFQLTPLLDLLLIVIFALFMEVRHKAESAQDEVEVQKVQLADEFNARRDELEQQYATQTKDLSLKRERYSAHYESIVKQHQQAGSALAAALDLPGTLMEQILQLRTDGQTTDADNLEAAVHRMQNQLKVRGNEMLQFILRYDEMQKHVSVWEIHLQDNGQAVFSDGDQAHTITFRTVEELVSRAFLGSKAFEEPKPLIIILLTHGDTQAGLRRRATDAMPLLIEQLRRDSGNTRWFDFSVMGFRPDGRLFGKLSK